MKITAVNHGPESADLHFLPTLWFRNDWSEWIAESNRAENKPIIKQVKSKAGTSAALASHSKLGELLFSCDGNAPLLFTENETNHAKLFPGQKNEGPYVKDGINDFVVHGNKDAVNPEKQGTKVAAHYQVTIGAGKSSVIRLRLSVNSPAKAEHNFRKDFDEIFADRLREADEFYKAVTPPSVGKDEANVMRQAIAGNALEQTVFLL